MKCSQIRKMISPYVDNELAPDELKLFTSHIQECPACKEELEEMQVRPPTVRLCRKIRGAPSVLRRGSWHTWRKVEEPVVFTAAALFRCPAFLLADRGSRLRPRDYADRRDVGNYAGRGQDIRQRDIRNADGRRRDIFSRPVPGNAPRFDRGHLRVTRGADR